MSAMSFNILEHLDEKPPEGCEPVDGGFSMFGRLRSNVKGSCFSPALQTLWCYIFSRNGGGMLPIFLAYGSPAGVFKKSIIRS